MHHNIIKTFLKNNLNILKQIVWEIQNGIKISVDQAVCELLIDTYKMSLFFKTVWDSAQDMLKFGLSCSPLYSFENYLLIGLKGDFIIILSQYVHSTVRTMKFVRTLLIDL